MTESNSIVCNISRLQTTAEHNIIRGIFFLGLFIVNGPLARYVKLPEKPGTFSPPPRVSNPDMHHGTCVTHVHWCMPRTLTSGFCWSGWRGKRSQHSQRMHKPQFYVSGKRPMVRRFWWRSQHLCAHIDILSINPFLNRSPYIFIIAYLYQFHTLLL